MWQTYPSARERTSSKNSGPVTRRQTATIATTATVVIRPMVHTRLKPEPALFYMHTKLAM